VCGGVGEGIIFLHIFYILEIHVYIFYNIKEDENPIPDESFS